MTNLDEEPESYKTENIRVFVRIKPVQNSCDETGVILVSSNEISISKSEEKDLKTFKFGRIFNESSTQLDVYKTVASPVVEKVLKGYNGTIFAYGQSGTGKTHTIIGATYDRGIIPNIFSHIFAQISLTKAEVMHLLTVTFLEIYNEEVRDLLGDRNKKLDVRESPELGVYVKDLSGFTVESMENAMELLVRGMKNRMTGCTRLNDTSSRSHAIFTLSIECRNKETNRSCFGKLNLVDLAGSERASKSMASGERLREAGKINLSLSVLGNVISALVDGKGCHIPYRNSKLTRLLQDSLGGSSLTAMIATISPFKKDFEENLYTLMYSNRVKHVQNCLRMNKESRSLLETFENKIKKLQQQLDKIMEKKKRKAPKRVEDEDLKLLEEEKSNLLEKIQIIQKKILVGGENLYEKAQEQLNLIEDSNKELDRLESCHQLLEETLNRTEIEKDLVVKECSSLQEEDSVLDSNIEETEKLLAWAERVMLKKEEEYQNEISALLYANKSLAKDMGMVNNIVNNFVSEGALKKIENQLIFDENLQEWKVFNVAHSGNNLRKLRSRKDRRRVSVETNSLLYKNYQ